MSELGRAKASTMPSPLASAAPLSASAEVRNSRRLGPRFWVTNIAISWAFSDTQFSPAEDLVFYLKADGYHSADRTGLGTVVARGSIKERRPGAEDVQSSHV